MIAELVTPTGAAILAALAQFTQPSLSLEITGTGAGKRDLDWPNVLRILIGEPHPAVSSHVELETNIDDMNPQLYDHIIQNLFAAGALDVYLTPIQMKKNRPAVKLSVIATSQDEDRLAGVLLRETTTLGVRVRPLHRHEAQREVVMVETDFGQIPIKNKLLEGKVIQSMPEYDVCSRLANQFHVPITSVIKAALVNKNVSNLIDKPDASYKQPE